MDVHSEQSWEFDSEFSGVMSGTAGLTKNGSGVLTLSGFNSYSGVTELTGGTPCVMVPRTISAMFLLTPSVQLVCYITRF